MRPSGYYSTQSKSRSRLAAKQIREAQGEAHQAGSG